MEAIQITTETPVKATKFDQSLKIILLKDFTGAILIFGKKAPFFWFSIPENLRIITEPGHLSFYEEFRKPSTQDKIIRYAGSIGLIVLIVKLVSDGLQYNDSDPLLPPLAGQLPFIPATILLFLLIGTNSRMRIKLITFDFNKNKVKLEPIKFSFIGTKTATISPPFNVKIRRNTREKQHAGSDGDGWESRWTTYHDGYEVMVNLEKLGYQSVMFLETDNLKQDYGDLISRLVTFAGIDDPLLEIDEN